MAFLAGVTCNFRKRLLASIFESLFRPLRSAGRQKHAKDLTPRAQRKASKPFRPMVFDSLEPRLLLNGDVFQAGQALTLLDGDGTQVTFALNGIGSGEVASTAQGFDVTVSGSNASTAVSVTTAGGDGRAKLHNLDVTGSLQAFTGANVDLTGDIDVSGTLGALTLGNIGAPHQIAVAGTGVALQFTAGDVVDLSLDVASAIGSIHVERWLDLDSVPDVVRTPSIGTLKSTGDFNASLELTGQGVVGFALTSANIGGAIGGGLWNVQGRAFQIVAQSIGPDWEGSFTGAMQSLTTKDDLSGQIATPAIQIITVGGDLVDARIYAGANLGADGEFGGFGAAADTFVKGTLARLRVTGSIIDSEIHIGVDPKNGTFDDGDDHFVAGSGMQELIVGQTIDDESVIISPLFPATVRVNGVSAPPSAFPALLTEPQDLQAPTLTAALSNDTGALADDGLTFDPTVNGSVTDPGTIVSLQAKLDGESEFIDITPRLNPDHTFTLDVAALETLAGGVLQDGAHVLHLQALDGGGNSGSAELAFILDTTRPETPRIALDPGSDSGRFDSDGITNDSTPTLNVSGEADSSIALFKDGVETGDLVLGPTGQITVGSLADGEHGLTATAFDAAGNKSDPSALLALTIDTQDPIAPSFELAAASDTPPPGDQQTTAAVAILTGITDPQARVRLLEIDVETTADKDGTFLFAEVSLALGANPFTARATDLAGNESEFARTIVRVEAPADDIDPPVIAAALDNDTGANTADGLTSDPTVRGSVTDASSIAAFRAGFDATEPERFFDVLTELEPDGSFTLDPPDLAAIAGATLAEGAHTLHLVAVDSFGNTSGSFDVAFMLDTLAPAASAPVLLAASDSGAADDDDETNDATPTLRVAAEDDALVRLFVNGIERGQGVATGGAIEFTLDVLADGQYALTATAEDAAGNTSTSAALALVIDTLAPIIAAFDLAPASDTPPPGDQQTTAAVVTLTGQTAPNTAVLLIETGATTTSDASGLFQFGGVALVLGANAFIVRATDLAGNESDFARTITRVEPPAAETDPPVIAAALANDTGSSAIDAVTFDATVAGTITDASPIVTFRAGFDATPEANFLDVHSALQLDGSFTLSAADLAVIAGGSLADGAHTLRLLATDETGNVSAIAELSFVLDTVAPNLSIEHPGDGETVMPGAELSGNADGTGSPIASLLYTLGALPPIGVGVESGGDFHQPLVLDGLEDGAFTLVLDATDAAGNAATVSSSLNLEVPFTITSHAPLDGMEQVGVTARPRIDFSKPVNAATLNASSFFATAGGETLPATIVLSNSGRLAWLYATGGLPGGSEVQITVDGNLILGTDGTALDADGDGQAGGVLSFAFRTGRTVPLSGTTLSGRVLDVGPDFLPMTEDDAAPGLDGVIGTDDDVFLLPVAGVPVFLLGLEDDVIHTDADGRFHFDAVPAGDVKVVIDGQEIAGPAGFTFPEVILDPRMAAGKANDLGAIYMPRLGDDVYTGVNAAETTTVTLTPGGALGLTDAQRQQFTLTVAGNSLLAADGQRTSAGEVGLGMVPVELLAPLLPTGMPAPLMAFTVQTRGFTDFSEPAQLTLPNLSNAAPGTQFLLLTFDHTTNQLVHDGTLVVSSAPGAPLVATLTGSSLLSTSQSLGDHTLGTFGGKGITFACFHVVVPGTPSDPCPPLAEPEVFVKPEPAADGLDHWFFKDDEGSFVLQFQNLAEPIDPNQDLCGPDNRKATPLMIDITIDGPADEFLNGLEGVSGTYGLLPGEELLLPVDVKDLLSGNAKYDRDRFYGASIKIVMYARNEPNVRLFDDTMYIYRFLDAADGFFDLVRTGHTDGVIEMPDTTNDGEGGVVRERVFDMRMAAAMEVNSTFLIADETHFPGSSSLDAFRFDPQALGPLSTPVSLAIPSGDIFFDILELKGEGRPKYKLFVDTAGLRTALAAIADDPFKVGLNERLITPLERALFDDDDKRLAIAEAVRDGILSRFAEFGAGIEAGGSATDDNTITVQFKFKGIGDELGTSEPAEGGGHGVDEDADMVRLIVMSEQPNRGEGELNFLLSQALNQRPTTKVDVFVGKHLETQTAPLNLTRDQLILSLVKTGAHEAAHTLGAPHSAKSMLTPGNNEKQTLSFAQTPGGITVSFSGSKTPSPIIFPGATASAVRDALEKLTTLGPNIAVSEENGVYTVEFNGAFTGIDVPELVATAAVAGETAPQVKTLEDGKSVLEVEQFRGTAKEIIRHGQEGRNDIMSQGFADLDGNDRFLSGLSREVVRIGLHLDWTPDEAFSALSYIKESDSYGLVSILDAIDGTVDALLLDGAHFGVFEPGEGPVFGSLDAGTVIADGAGGASATRTLHLASTGDANVVIRSVALVDSTGSWTVSPVVSGTVLAPGERLPLQITLDPLATGSLDAILRISFGDANDVKDIALRGAGLSLAGDIRVEVANNNLGGRAVSDGAALADDVVTLRNIGASALTITGMNVVGESAAQFGVTGLPAGFGAGNPLVLASGATFTFDVTFDPSVLGLQRAQIEIVSDDADTPALRRTIVGTGLADQGSALEYRNDFVAVEFTQAPGIPVMRTVSDASGNWLLYLSAGEAFHNAVFDPVSGLVAHGFGMTSAAGVETHLLSPMFRASTAPDADGDGLPDDVEFAIGSALDAIDTDNDGLDDFAEIRLGGSPLDGVAGPSGIIGALQLTGEAWDIALDGTTAYVAMGDGGLAIIDVTDPLFPVLTGAIDLAGVSSTVAVDGLRDLAVLGSQFVAPGLRIVDVSNPSAPKTVRTISIGVGVGQVEVLDGMAYAASGAALLKIEIASGEVLQTLELGDAALAGFAREGALLFTMDVAGTLRAIDISSFIMVARDDLDVAHAGGDVFVGGGIAYLANRNGFFGGFATVDVSDPDDLVLISGSDVASGIRPDRALAADGSGRVLVVGLAPDPQNPGLSIPALDVADATDPVDTSEYLTRVALPESPIGITLAAGVALIADGDADLLVVGYRSVAGDDAAPAVVLGTLARDLDPAAPGTQVAAGSLIHLLADATDDVLVRSVDLLANGVRVATDLSFPHEALLVVQTTGTLTLQARAIDGGGNVSLSNALVLEIVPDTFAPEILVIDPPDQATLPEGLQTVSVRFDEALDPATVTTSNVRVVDDSGEPVSIDAIELRSEGRVVELSFAGLSAGDYEVVIAGALVTDLAGNPLAADDVISSFTLTADAIRWINPNGGFWDDAANWEGGVLPGANDNVLIDVPGATVAIFHSSGTTVVNRIISRENLIVNGGVLDVATTLLVDGQLDIVNGATLAHATVLDGSGPAPSVSGFATFDGVALATDLVVGAQDALQVRNGLRLEDARVMLFGADLTFDGAQSLGGFGEVIFSGIGIDSSIDATGGPLTIGENITIRGNRGRVDGFTDGIRLEGTVSAESPGETIVIDGIWTNAGRLIGAGGRLELDGTFSFEDRAIFNATKGQVVLTGTVDNSDKTLTVDAITGSLTVDGGRIRGGHLVLADGVELGIEGTATLEGVRLDSDLAISGLRELIVVGGLTLAGSTIELIDDVALFGPRLTFQGTQTLQGTGRILFTGPGDDGTLAVTSSTATLTIGPDITINSTAPSIGLSGRYVNQGVIAFETNTSSSILVNTTSFNNQGTLRLLNGADMLITNLTNAGTLALGPGSVLSGSVSTFTVVQTAGVIDLQGGTINVGTIDIQGGKLVGAGTIDANVINAGRIEPGHADGDQTGTITISNGNFTQTAAGALAIQLGGTVTTDYDRLLVALIGSPIGTATPGGTLELSLVGGFAPALGNTLDIITYEALAAGSAFATITGLDIDGGLQLQPSIEATRVRLQVVSAPANLPSSSGATVEASVQTWSGLNVPMAEPIVPVIDLSASLASTGVESEVPVQEGRQRRWLGDFVNGLGRSTDARFARLKISLPSEQSSAPDRAQSRALLTHALRSQVAIATTSVIGRT